MPPKRTQTRSNSASRTDNGQHRTADSQKRNLSPASNSDTESSTTTTTKKHKTTNMSSDNVDEIKNLITSSMINITQQIKSSQQLLEDKLTQLESNVNAEVLSLRSSVDDFKSKINNDIGEVKLCLTQHEQRITNTEDDIERLQRGSDLRLIGFPSVENENLIALFERIANEIGYSTSAQQILPLIERLSMKNRTTGQLVPSGTIMIRFAMVKQKQTFYSCYLNKMPLKPEIFGLPNTNRITIGEHLTLKNTRIFKTALLLKRDSKIAQVFTENGLVKVRLSKGKHEATYTIRNVTELEILVTRNEQHSHQPERSNVTATNVNNAHAHVEQPFAHNQNGQPPHSHSHNSNADKSSTTTHAQNFTSNNFGNEQLHHQQQQQHLLTTPINRTNESPPQPQTPNIQDNRMEIGNTSNGTEQQLPIT